MVAALLVELSSCSRTARTTPLHLPTPHFTINPFCFCAHWPLVRCPLPPTHTYSTHLLTFPSRCVNNLQIWILEKNGGSLVGGAIKLFQDRKNNPPPPRDPRLPPKPKGQTVGSFKKGLRTLTDAIGDKLKGELSAVFQHWSIFVCDWVVLFALLAWRGWSENEGLSEGLSESAWVPQMVGRVGGAT